MKKKLIGSIIVIVFGFLIFIAGSQKIGAILVAIGLLLWSLYEDEKNLVERKKKF